jgi:hypothetical protein
MGGGVTSMEGTHGSWITVTPHVPTWIHLRSAHSIGSCRTECLVAGDSVLLFENLDGICLVRQIMFQWDGVFHNHIGWRLQTSLELGDMKHIMNLR